MGKLQKQAGKFKELETEFNYNFAEDVVDGEKLSKSDVERFIQLCEDAMVVSFHKYGPVREGFGPGKAIFAIDSLKAKQKLYDDGGVVKDEYQEPGNIEFLVDVFNYAMIEAMCPREDLSYKKLVKLGKEAMREFINPKHPTAYYRPTDASIGRATIEGMSDRPNKYKASVTNFR